MKIGGMIQAVVIILGLCSTVIAGDSTNRASGPIDSKKQALMTAIEYLGPEHVTADLSKLRSEVRHDMLRDSTTPFLSSLFGRGPVWRILVQDVSISRLPYDSAKLETYRDFEVFLDSVTGRLLKIECFHGDQTELNKHPLSAQDAEEQIYGAGHGDVYSGVPDELPATTYISALLACRADVLGSAMILGQYVMQQESYTIVSTGVDTATPPTPAWVISLVGTKSVVAIGGDISFMPEYTRNRLRLVINATTGRLRSSDTSPSVPLTPEDKERIFPSEYRKK